MTLLEARLKYHLSQLEVATSVGVPLRTYIRYEKDNLYGSELKRTAMIKTIEDIRNFLAALFNDKYPGEIDFCYLFGSYAKGYAKENSDVDLCISTNLSGLRFVGLSEDIRITLNKKVDLIRLSNLSNNLSLITEIMKDGIKIYEQ